MTAPPRQPNRIRPDDGDLRPMPTTGDLIRARNRALLLGDLHRADLYEQTLRRRTRAPLTTTPAPQRTGTGVTTEADAPANGQH